MKHYRITITPQSAFGTPLVGDTLFGQLCWAIRNRFSDEKLTQLLQGYTTQQPFMVISDAFPYGYIPLPHLPSAYWKTENETDRKKLKKKQWVSLNDLARPLAKWQQSAVSSAEIFKNGIQQTESQPHNSINRATGTTGEDGFAPYEMEQIWFNQGVQLDIYLLLDEAKLSKVDFQIVLQDIADFGFGRDVSIGLGKFAIDSIEPHQWHIPANSNSYLALANCAPQNIGLNRDRTFYQITTRFGRHGDLEGLAGQPFKKPIILTKAGAVLTPTEFSQKNFMGNGLGDISISQENAVHQGYAVVVPLSINFETEKGECND